MIVLRPCQLKDIPDMCKIIDAAWTHDTNTLIKGSMRGEGWLGKDFGEYLPSWFESPRIQIVVAVEEETDTPVGFCAWGFRGFDEKNELPGLKAFDAEDEAVRLPSPTEEAISKATNRAPPDVPSMPEMTEAEKKAGQERIDAMEDVSSGNTDEWMNSLMPEGCKCVYINSICTSPAVQGTGVGAALARWGMRRADRAGTYAWVHGSEAAAPVFQKLDWKVLGNFQLDLDEWDPRPEGEREGKWGKYTFTYMRWPTVAERQATAASSP